MSALEKQLVAGKYAPDHLYGVGCSGERIAELLAKVPLQVEKKLAD
jgi:hypothetical protein